MTTTATPAGFSYDYCEKCEKVPATYYAPAEDGSERSLCEFCANEDYPGEVPTLTAAAIATTLAIEFDLDHRTDPDGTEWLTAGAVAVAFGEDEQDPAWLNWCYYADDEPSFPDSGNAATVLNVLRAWATEATR